MEWAQRPLLLAEHLPGLWSTHRTLLSYWAEPQSHCCKTRQGSASQQHFPEEMSPPDFLDRQLNSPAPPNKVLDFSFLKEKKETLCFTKTTYLSQEIVRDSEGNLPASSVFCTASATKRHRISSQEVSFQPGTPHHAVIRAAAGKKHGKPLTQAHGYSAIPRKVHDHIHNMKGTELSQNLYENLLKTKQNSNKPQTTKKPQKTVSFAS